MTRIIVTCFVLFHLATGLFISGCTLETIEGDEANYITASGTGPDGKPLGFALNTIPMVDSTIIIRVLVADTLGTRSGQGLPSPVGIGRVQWTVTDGTVSPEVSEIGEFGIAETNWTLGTDISLQTTITGTLISDGVVDAEIRLSFSGQQNVGGFFPGPPVELTINQTEIQLQEGASAAFAVSALIDKYGNAWDLELFDFSLASSDSTIVANTLGGNAASEENVVRGNRAGSATLTMVARGKLTSAFDFRSLTATASVPVTVQAFEGFNAVLESVSTGSNFVCAVAGDGTEATSGLIYCWGGNETGRLGLPSLISPILSAPRPDLFVVGLPSGASVRAMTSGQGHTCAALDDGSVYCWGANGSRQLASFGTDPGANRALLDNPNAASALETGYVDLAAGAAHTCALGESGLVYCWGENANGQLGNGQAGRSEILSQQVLGLEGVTVTSLATAGPEANHTCAITESGALYCWGRGDSGQIGDGAQQDRPVATLVSGGIAFVDASTSFNPETGTGYTCGIEDNGTLYCWGDRPTGPGINLVPEPLLDGSSGGFSSLATAPQHACMTSLNGNAYCFGIANQGRLGNGVIQGGVQFSEPQLVGNLTDLSVIQVGNAFSLSIKNDGSAWSWGDNRQGQLGGVSDASEGSAPMSVVFLTTPPDNRY